MKKLILFIIILFVLPTCYAENWEDYEYRLFDDGSAEIVGYYGTGDGILEIPEMVNETIPVTSIGELAFAFSNLTSVILPDGITTIGTEAFLNSRELESLTIPDSVTSIGTFAFTGCIRLETITIPDRTVRI